MVMKVPILPELAMSPAVIVTVICEALTKVAERGAEPLPTPMLTTDALTKPDPLIVSVKSAPPEKAFVGEMLEIDGTGLRAELTCSDRNTLCCLAPEVPVIVIVIVPTAADEEAVRLRVDDALPPAAGLTLAGEKAAVTPAGTPAILRLVAELKPPRLPTLTVARPPLP